MTVPSGLVPSLSVHTTIEMWPSKHVTVAEVRSKEQTDHSNAVAAEGGEDVSVRDKQSIGMKGQMENSQRHSKDSQLDHYNVAVDHFLDLLARLIAREHLRRSADGQALTSEETTKTSSSK